MKLMNHQKALFDKVVEYFDFLGWKCEVKDDNKRIAFTMGIRSKLKSCRVIISTSENAIQVYAVPPVHVPPKYYPNVVEFITRANYRVNLGAFRFNYKNGRLCFHTILPLTESVPTLKEVKRMIVIPILMLQKYGDGLVKNMLGYGNPEADIAEIDNQ